ncbi:hypothetical protein [Microcella sp.]|uniref:hypothetical protein n=1 Tax=Microcella sp. TaxID=1913979 RepID=UPI00391C3D6E
MDTLPMHQPSFEEVLPWDCIYGECSHEGDCEPLKIEACRACSEAEPPVELEELQTIIPWDVAEARGHAPVVIPSSPDSGASS